MVLAVSLSAESICLLVGDGMGCVCCLWKAFHSGVWSCREDTKNNLRKQGDDIRRTIGGVRETSAEVCMWVRGRVRCAVFGVACVGARSACVRALCVFCVWGGTDGP